jgi:hypothetical protein
MAGTGREMLLNKISYYDEYGEQYCCCVGFEVLTAVVMKSIIFWDMTYTRRHIPEDDTLNIVVT